MCYCDFNSTSVSLNIVSYESHGHDGSVYVLYGVEIKVPHSVNLDVIGGQFFDLGIQSGASEWYIDVSALQR